MKIPDEKKIRALTPDQRKTLLANARKLGGEAGKATEALILSLNLPLSSGGMSFDHPIHLEMQDIIWSAEGKAAAIDAVEKGLPAMAGLDPLLQKRMENRYSAEQQGTSTAGSIAAEMMRHIGYEKLGEDDLPPGCIAKTAATWKRKTPLS